jgi:uncharacterized glyoxalase superfamily protein PhnB
MKLNPYLSFDDRCREAFEFYQKALGGNIAFIQTIGESPMASTMPPESHGRVMHVTLHIGDQVLQGADAPSGQFTKPAGFCVAVHFDEAAEGNERSRPWRTAAWFKCRFRKRSGRRALACSSINSARRGS